MARKWELLVTRRIGIQVAQQWNHAFWLMQKPFGIGIDDTRIVWDGHKTQYFVDARQLRQFEQGMREKLRDALFVRHFARDARRFLESQSRAIRKECQTDFSRLSDRQLARRFRKVSATADEYYTRMWLVFLINEPLAQAVMRTLARFAPGEADGLLLAFSSPLRPNEAIRERQDLLRIALQPASRHASLLDRHWRKYRHIPVFDFNHEPWPLEHFKAELDRIEGRKAAKGELEETEATFKKRRRAFASNLSSLHLDSPGLEAAQIRMLSDLAFLRDHRDSLRQKMNLALRNLYGEIARRAGMTIGQVSLLTTDEIHDLVLHPNARSSLRQAAQKREKGFVLIESPGKTKVTANKTLKKRKTVAGAVCGIEANPGTAIGVARLVLTNLDLPKIRDGDVLVAAMTRQDFVPYIRRCAALVTDEGGVTCHAAIIARELGIPCIVGTKDATRKLTDGQRVRVDANLGQVVPNRSKKL